MCRLLNKFCFFCAKNFALGPGKLEEAANFSFNRSLHTTFSAYCTMLIDPEFKWVLFMVTIESAPVRSLELT